MYLKNNFNERTSLAIWLQFIFPYLPTYVLCNMRAYTQTRTYVCL